MLQESLKQWKKNTDLRIFFIGGNYKSLHYLNQYKINVF